jgi:hypothetical protein
MGATIDRSGDTGTPDWDPELLLDTPLGHELRELARRIAGPGPPAAQAVRAALEEPLASRLEAIARTAMESRRRAGGPVSALPVRGRSLSAAVAAELEVANATLPQPQREALALRELPRLSYRQIGQVLGMEGPAVALLLARARLALREALRGPYPHEVAACSERDRALRILAARQDSEPLDGVDDVWIFTHMAQCPGCERAHLMMLEASFRYRAWVRR